MNTLLENFRELDADERQQARTRLIELLTAENPPDGAVKELEGISQKLGLGQSDLIDLNEKIQDIRRNLRILDDEPTANQMRRNTQSNYLRAKRARELLDRWIDEQIKRYYFDNLACGNIGTEIGNARRAIDRLRATDPQLVDACEKHFGHKAAAKPIAEVPWDELLDLKMPGEPEPKPEPQPVPAAESAAPQPQPTRYLSDEKERQEAEIDAQFAKDLEAKGRNHVREPYGGALTHDRQGRPRTQWVQAAGTTTQT